MVGGVPQVGLLLLFVLGIVFVYGLRLYIAIVPIALMFLVMRHLSKKDQWLIDIVMENVMQKDVLLP
jgi:type IV secretory pathway VirB3-like protein